MEKSNPSNKEPLFKNPIISEIKKSYFVKQKSRELGKQISNTDPKDIQVIAKKNLEIVELDNNEEEKIKRIVSLKEKKISGDICLNYSPEIIEDSIENREQYKNSTSSSESSGDILFNDHNNSNEGRKISLRFRPKPGGTASKTDSNLDPFSDHYISRKGKFSIKSRRQEVKKQPVSKESEEPKENKSRKFGSNPDNLSNNSNELIKKFKYNARNSCSTNSDAHEHSKIIKYKKVNQDPFSDDVTHPYENTKFSIRSKVNSKKVIEKVAAPKENKISFGMFKSNPNPKAVKITFGRLRSNPDPQATKKKFGKFGSNPDPLSFNDLADVPERKSIKIFERVFSVKQINLDLEHVSLEENTEELLLHSPHRKRSNPENKSSFAGYFGRKFRDLSHLEKKINAEKESNHDLELNKKIEAEIMDGLNKSRHLLIDKSNLSLIILRAASIYSKISPKVKFVKFFEEQKFVQTAVVDKIAYANSLLKEFALQEDSSTLKKCGMIFQEVLSNKDKLCKFRAAKFFKNIDSKILKKFDKQAREIFIRIIFIRDEDYKELKQAVEGVEKVLKKFVPEKINDENRSIKKVDKLKNRSYEIEKKRVSKGSVIRCYFPDKNYIIEKFTINEEVLPKKYESQKEFFLFVLKKIFKDKTENFYEKELETLFKSDESTCLLQKVLSAGTIDYWFAADNQFRTLFSGLTTIPFQLKFDSPEIEIVEKKSGGFTVCQRRQYRVHLRTKPSEELVSSIQGPPICRIALELKVELEENFVDEKAELKILDIQFQEDIGYYERNEILSVLMNAGQKTERKFPKI